ncbi:unnamed protein product [Calypogeia fissa]
MRIVWNDPTSSCEGDISGERESRSSRGSRRCHTSVKKMDPEQSGGVSAPPSAAPHYCALYASGVSCFSCSAMKSFREVGLRSYHFRADECLKSLQTLPILRKRSVPNSKNDTSFSKRKKFHHKLRADSEDIATRRQSLENHMAVKNIKDDGESFRVDSLERTENVADICKRRNRKIRAAKEDVARRRETLRSYTALKNSDGQGCRNSGESILRRSIDRAQGGTEAREDDGTNLQITAAESNGQMLDEIRSYPEEAEKLLAGLRELNKHLQELDTIFRKCKELSAMVATMEAPQAEMQGENEGVEETDINLAPLCSEVSDIVMVDAAPDDGIRDKTSVSQFIGNKKFDDDVIEINSDSDDGGELLHAKSHDSTTHFGQRMRALKGLNILEKDESIHCLSVKYSGHEIVSNDKGDEPHFPILLSSDDEEGANGKKVPDMDQHDEEVAKGKKIMDNGTSQSQLEEEHPESNKLALEVVDNGGSSEVGVAQLEPIVCTPLASKPPVCMQKLWATRIRKDGTRWRRKKYGWTHIKRKYLSFKRYGQPRVTKTEMNLDDLLRKERPKEETKFLDDIPVEDEDEDVPDEADRRDSHMAKDVESDWDEPYEPYCRRNSYTAKEAEPDSDDELDDIFQEMDLHKDKGWEKQKPAGKQTEVSNGGCDHDYVFQDDVGLVCEKCGRVGRDIQSIFVPADAATRPKKKAAIRPVEEEEEFLESEEYQRLAFAQGALSKVTLNLHPYYEERLHPHQKEGIAFLTMNLLGNEQMKLPPGGCILAHAPGTGKSCLTVSFVQSFLTAYPNGRPLIVAPKIMLKTWQNEFKEWNVEEIPVYNLNETLKQGKKKSRRERDELANVITSTPYYKERKECRRLRIIKKWLESRSVLLISYPLFVSMVMAAFNDENTGSVKQQLCEALLDGPELLILDEGHHPRTKRTKISQALMRVRTNRRILLTGTLFQNNFKELFTLLKMARHDFMSLSPEFASRLKKMNLKLEPSSDEDCNHFAGRTLRELNLPAREVEEQMFMDHIGYKLKEFVDGAENFEEINVALKKLRELTRPIVDRYAGEILESLPGLHEFVVYLNLSDHQHELLSHLKCKSSFEEKSRLTEVCIHPELLKYDEENDNNPFNSQQQDPSEGVKTAFVFRLLHLCNITNERVLIFCQTLSPLTLIESMLTEELGWSMGQEILRLDGKMSSDERQRMIEVFNDKNTQARVMLASITACKEGISLVGASRVVILDVLYNPSVVRQAVSRAFRIGQTKKVYVYRLVGADTKEERIFQAAVQKDWLSRVLIDHSLRLSGANSYRAEKILQPDKAPDDRVLQKLLHTDEGKRINRVCRYQSDFSK